MKTSKKICCFFVFCVSAFIVFAGLYINRENKDNNEVFYNNTVFASNLGAAASLNGYTYNETLEFEYTGDSEKFAVYGDGYYIFEVWGASGGGNKYNTANDAGPNGLGGFSYGEIELKRGNTLYINVGGAGKCAAPGLGVGGFNGGGYSYGSAANEPGCGGGGGSDIRINGNTFYDRVIVAGGGGGGGEDKADAVGHGGGTSGTIGGGEIAAGGPTSGGTGAVFGIGASTSNDGGAGGGGWYGGGTVGGTQTRPTSGNGSDAQGGSGGSGYVFTEATASQVPAGYKLNQNYYLKNAYTTAGSNTFASPNGTNETGHLGNGYVRITCYNNCHGSTDLGLIKVGEGTSYEQFIYPDSGKTVHDIEIPTDLEATTFDLYPVESCATLSTDLTLSESMIIPGGITVYNVIVVGGQGNTTIHTIKVHRNISDNTKLNNIFIDGVAISGFDPDNHIYNVDLTYDRTTLDITVDKQNVYQKIAGLGKFDVDDNKETLVLEVTAENGYSKGIYTINFTRAESAYLKTLTSRRMRFVNALSPGVFNYRIVKADYNSNDLLIYETADKDATATLSGDLASEGKVTITVSKEGFESSVYTITQSDDFGFGYTGYPELFVAPYTAEYTLHVWGAEGMGRRLSDNKDSGIGGAGGYSTGTVLLEKGTKLYIYVGSMGTAATNGIAYGGYNGGGAAWASSATEPANGGGGATDMRLVKNDLYSRIIVAGGGGGGGEDANDTGGVGGGTSGGSGGNTGGSQSAGGTGAVFGLGANTRNDGGGGGGGWYGGGTVAGTQTLPTSNSSSDAQGGAGGSGYVLTSDSYKPAGYNVDSKYYLTNATTLAGSSTYIPTHDLTGTMTGNLGNGFALIEVSRILSDNKYLKELTITINGHNYPIAFDKDTGDYYVGVDPDDTDAVITAIPEDDAADVFMDGDGVYSVPSGSNDYQIEVIAGNGDTKIYTIHFTRNKSSYKYLKDIKMNGKSIEGFEPTKLNYIVRVPYYEVSNLLIQGIAARSEQRVIGNGIIEITGTTFSQLIQVYSEDETQNTIYTVTFIVDHSSKLKKLKIGDMELSPRFYRETYEYEVQLSENPLDAFFDVIPYDPEATVTYQGDLARGDNTLHIIVSEPHSENTEYIIRSKGEYDFFPGQMTVWTAPVSGIFRLETWGAQGGYRSNATMGGKGGYTAGTITVTQGTQLYIYVGSSGNQGGFNGGGARQGYTNNRGGGATDIRFAEGDLYSRVIVAGGGGSDGSTGRPGGYAGGATGESRTQSYGSGGGGATQTAGGAGGNNNGGTFGIGGTGLARSNGYGGAGGGGWYGGGGTYPDGSGDDDRGGGGGSSFAYGDDSNAELPSSYNVLEKYKLTDTVLIAGNASMTSPAGTTTVGNAGNGFARITLIEAHSGDTTLSSLTTNKGTWDKAFTPKVKEYTVYLGSEDYKVEIDATVNSRSSVIREGDLGEKEIASPTDSKEVLVTAEDGTTSVYVIHFERPGSNYKYLDDITINGVSVEGFAYNKFNYDVNLRFDVLDTVEVVGVHGRPSQNIAGDGTIDVRSGKATVNIEVVSEDGSAVTTYTLTLNKTPSTKLRSLVVGGDNDYDLEPEFDPEVYEYDVEVAPTTLNLAIDAIPFDGAAKVSVVGNGYIPKKDKEVTITVTREGLETTVYTLNVTKINIEDIPTFDYPYTGDVQVFEAPYIGNFQLEVWGSEGMGRRLSGNSSSGLGGLGGYSVGTLSMRKGDKLYIYVGGTGTAATSGIAYGGYNGGGVAWASSAGEPSNGGGGATDMRLSLGDLYSRIIVAGGGGGGGEDSGDRVGYGGGTSGGTGGAAGGTQSAGGTGAVFGLGGNTRNDGGGGGGGWYGGGTVAGSQTLPTSNSSSDAQGGGGGSGYVLTSDSYKPAGYEIDEKYYLTDAKTVGGNASMPNVNGGFTTGRLGNGYARITYVKAPSENNYLEELLINRGEVDSEFDKDFPEILEYNVELDSDVTQVEIKGIAADPTATIVGNGVYKIPASRPDGEPTQVDLIVTAESGDTRTYSITFERDASDSTEVNNIVITGFIPSLCSISSDTYDYCDYSFDIDTEDYEVVVPRRIKQLQFAVLKGHEYQTVNIYRETDSGDVLVTDGVAVLTEKYNYYRVEITSEDNENTMEYYYTFHRDMAGNNDLSDLSLEVEEITTTDDGDVSTFIDLIGDEFDTDITEYYVTIPRTYDSFKLRVRPDDVENASVIVDDISYVETYYPEDSSNWELYIPILEEQRGTNMDLQITVIASNGEEKIYTVYLWLALDDNVFLRDINVYDYNNNVLGDAQSLTPTFNKIVTNYTVNIPNSISRIKIVPTKDSSKSTVDIEEYYDIPTGITKIPITVTSEDDNNNTYYITVNRAKNSNKDLSLLRLLSADKNNVYPLTDKDGNTISFDKDILEYYAVVPASTYSLYVDAIAAVNTSSISVSGNTNIKSGVNKIKIRVTAEDKTYKDYYIYATRTLSDENTLKTLVVKNGSTTFNLTPAFEQSVLTPNNFVLDVENSIKYLDISATPTDSRSKVSGTGRTSLAVGDTTIEIVVTSESGEGHTYTIIVNRAQNGNANLASITNDKKGTLSPSFNKDTREYTLTVTKETTNVTLTATPEVNTSVVTGNGEMELTLGDNYRTFTVTAEDGTTKDYVVNVIRDLSVINTLDSLAVEEGVLSPAFTSSNTSYKVTVPNDIEDVTIRATTTSPLANINIIKPSSLIVGENTIKVEVIPEKGEDYKKVYTIVVTRNPEKNTYLSSLSVSEGVLSPVFEKHTQYYNVSVDSNITSIVISATAESNIGVVNGTGTKNLNYGDNTFYVTVTTFDGTTRTYTIVVNRPKPKTAGLLTLTSSTGEFDPSFASNSYQYQLFIDEDVESLVLDGTALTDNIVYGLGEVSTLNDETYHNVIATSFDGDTAIYSINIVKTPLDSVYIKKLIAKDGIIIPDFDKLIDNYEITVTNDVNALDLDITLESPRATYVINGNTLTESENDVVIRVTNGNNSKDYTIRVNKQEDASDAVLLASLSVDNYSISPQFNENTTYYELTVPKSTDEVMIRATAKESTSTISGDGANSLVFGSNMKRITVTDSATGVYKVYTININRKLYDCVLTSISSDTGEIIPTFASSKKDYILIVPEDTTTYTINATAPLDIVILGTGEYTFVEGQIVNIFATSPDGEVATYDIEVTSDATIRSSTLAKNIVVKEGELSPEFNPLGTDYLVKVPYEVTNPTITATLLSPNASYQVINGTNLDVGSNQVIVRVTNGSETKDYNINIIRQAPASKSNYLTSITTNRGNLNPTFVKTKLYYTLTVDNDVTSIIIDATLEDEEAQLEGIGLHELTVGENVIPLKVTSSDGVERTYQVVVTRKYSNNSKLNRLVINGDVLNPSFDPDVTSYTLQTAKSSIDFLEIVPEEPMATYEVTGNTLRVGNNIVKIKVTAPDKTSYTNYVINVTKNPSNNNNLRELYIEDVEFTYEFNKATTLYYATVGSEINAINIVANPEDSNATVTGAGSINLQSGQNILEVTVTSESGVDKVYTIVVTKELSDNYYLSSLAIEDLNLNETFYRDIDRYTITVPYSVSNINVLATPEDDSAVVTGTGSKDLVVGENLVEVIVTAENNTTKTYVIVVTRERCISPYIESIDTGVYDFNPKFNKELFDYVLTVDYEVTSLVLDDTTITLEDDEATIVSVSGNSNFSVGYNTVTIVTQSSNGVDRATYTITVNRLPYANNFLAYIGLSNGTLNPIFNEKTLMYDVEVPYNVSSITITTEPDALSSTVNILGNTTSTYPLVADISLVQGMNVIPIVVTSANGISRTYKINVNRLLSNNTHLSDLVIKNGNATLSFVDTEFDPEVYVYYLEDLPVGVDSLNVIATPEEPSSKVTGAGNVSITKGDNSIVITVTALNGDVRDYVVNVFRTLDTNNYLTDLIPSIGQLDPPFDYYTDEYDLVLSSNASLLSFEASRESAYSTITGIEQQPVLDGTNDRIITIISEDNQTRTITVHVTKARQDEARLKSLEVKNGTVTLTPAFDSDTFVYEMTVPYDMAMLKPSDITAVPIDSNATVVKQTALTLTTANTNIYNIKVTAIDGFTEQNYTLKVTRTKSSDATLSKLQIGNYKIEPALTKDNFDYTVYVPRGIESIYDSNVTAIPTDTAAKVSKMKYLPVTALDDNIYDISVTSDDGSVTNIYHIRVAYAQDTDARLATLVPSCGVLSPEFNRDTKSYTLSLNSIQDRVSFTGTTVSEYAQITSGLDEIAVNVSTLTHDIIVTAEDGTTMTYTLTVNRSSGTDANLKQLSFENFTLSPVFDPYTYTYKLRVPKGTTLVSDSIVTAVPNDPYATVALPGDLTISEDNKTYTISVTSANGEVTQDYVMTTEYILSTDARLATLESNFGTFDPTFESNKYSYTLNVRDTQNSVELSGTTIDPYATIISGMGQVTLDEESITRDIIVQAENGNTQTYTLTIVKSVTTERYLENIELTGIESDNCIQALKWCVLSSPFSPTTTQYSITVPSDIEIIGMVVTKRNKYQKVTYTRLDGTPFDPEGLTLEYGRNTFDVTVTNGLNQSTTYRYTIDRKASDNANLSSITLSNPTPEPNLVFDPDAVEYTVSIDGEYSSIDVTATTEDPDASYRVIGNERLWEGNNDVVIEVTAKSGIIKQYIIHVYRKPTHNNLLSLITVSVSGVGIVPLSPTFVSTTKVYTANVSSTVGSATIQAVADDPKTTVTIPNSNNGEVTLKPGLNSFEVIAKPEIGDSATYTVNIIREETNNVYLSNLIIKNGTMSPEFNRELNGYTVYIGSNVKSVDMDVFLEDSNATYKIGGNKNLVAGHNRVTIAVTSSNKKRTKTYILDVIKEGSSNNYLRDLQLDGVQIEGFDKYDQDYSLTVPYDKNTINVLGIKDDEMATITGNGSYSLEPGENVITINVVSESGSVRSYVITILREYNNYLESLTIDEGTLIPVFNREITNYTVNLPSNIKGITVLGRKEDSNATVTGNGYYNLNKGPNNIVIRVSNSETSYKEYTVVVNRAYDDDNTLNSLVVSEGIFTPEFDSLTEDYYLTVPYEVTSLNLIALPTLNTSEVKVSGNSDFNICSEENIYCNTVTINVKSENDKANNLEGRNYLIHVNRTDEEIDSSKLSDLSVTPGVLSPTFDRNIFSYSVNVASDVETILISATAEDTNATISGTGSKNLSYGANPYSIVVTNNGNTHTYTVIVNRALSSDARIKELSFIGGSLNEEFSPDRTDYTMDVSCDTLNLSEVITMMEPLGQYRITGHKNLAGGENKIIISTDSPNREAHKTYIITVTKALANENYLLTLTSNIGTISPTFDKNVISGYTLSVPYGTNSVNLSGTISQRATVTGLGVVNIISNRQIANITVTAEDGTTKVYSIVIERQLNDDNYLKALSVNEGDISPEFNKDTLRYTLDIDSDVTEININAVPNDPLASVLVEIPTIISYGVTTVPITVTAQNGSKRTYYIDVNKPQELSARIANLIIYNGTISPDFVSTSNEYIVNVQGDVNALLMDIELEDSRASKVITGNSNFKTGMNTVTITVTNGSLREVYVLKVDKQMLSNNYLNSLYTDTGDLVPEFDPAILNYKVSVGANVERIGIFAEANDQMATITGPGMYNLETGDNTFAVEVTSRTGIKRTYTIVVTRDSSDENKLLSLATNIGDFVPEFDPDTNTYTLNVPAETAQVTLTGDISQRASVVGLGDITLQAGIATHTITVTSESGRANVYTININRPSSKNAMVTDIRPSHGTLTPSFENNTKVYSITIKDDTVNDISFEVDTESPLASVVGNELTTINYGTNVINIVVTAEDGVTTNTFIINVTKVRLLEDIEVDSPISLTPGGSTDIVVRYIPVDTDQTGVTYRVMGNQIITVSETGHVVSNGTPGVSAILVTSTVDPTIMKTIQVNVQVSELSSSVFEIRRHVPMYDYVDFPLYDEANYIRGIQPGMTTVEDLINGFDNDKNMLHVYDMNGNEVTDKNEIVGTNMVLKLESGGVVYDSLTITVFGDFNGDGYCDALDYTTINRYMLYLTDISDAAIFALDVNDDGYVDVLDYNTINRYLLYLQDDF